MAKHRLGKANQKLYFANLHLDSIKAVEHDQSLLNKQAVIQANREASVICLESAYRSFIWEICHTYDIDIDYGMPLTEVITKAESEGKQIQELNHFLSLELNEQSWLHELIMAFEKIVSLDPHKFAEINSVVSFNAIEVKKVEESETPEKILQWHNTLKTEIESFRTTLSEW
ncbi:MAG: hypothetical protein MI976_08175 [Pseudomonadales bacterium]|nr:hypothetical protein [Pseudomonadales bacterium]